MLTLVSASREIADSLQLFDGLDEELQPTKAEGHLARLKKEGLADVC